MKPAIKAVRLVHGVRTEYYEVDCKILNRVAMLLIQHGAISSERLQDITKYGSLTVNWALWHLEAVETPAQLWIFPEAI